MITVVDYGMGNLGSVTMAIRLFTKDVRVSDDPKSVRDSKALVLPGDGAFGAAMQNLKSRGWIGPLRDFVGEGKHFLGICLGYQLLFSSSEEFGSHEGLGFIPGKVVRFKGDGLKVPHMGWNNVSLTRESKFMKGIPTDSYFYFIHTFYPVPEDHSVVLGESEYGERFACIVERGNLIATQFHPEKSHNAGIQIIENFVRDIQ
jgi:imidazole glycerol-phosphate synthase subunit HisH